MTTITEQFYVDASVPAGQAIGATSLSTALALPTGEVVALDNLSLLSVSSYRATFPVGGFSRVGPRGFTRGHRLLAGTLVFTVFDRGAFTNLLTATTAPAAHESVHDRRSGRASGVLYDMKADALPPFDLHMVYITPQGLYCYEGLRGVVVSAEGSVRSVDLVRVQESFSYQCRDRIPIQRLDSYVRAVPVSRVSATASQVTATTSEILGRLLGGL